MMIGKRFWAIDHLLDKLIKTAWITTKCSNHNVWVWSTFPTHVSMWFEILQTYWLVSKLFILCDDGILTRASMIDTRTQLKKLSQKISLIGGDNPSSLGTIYFQNLLWSRCKIVLLIQWNRKKKKIGIKLFFVSQLYRRHFSSLNFLRSGVSVTQLSVNWLS